MAIFQPADTFTQPQVQAGVMFSIGAQGQPVAVASTNNRAKGTSTRARALRPGSAPSGAVPAIPSTEFMALDSLILRLDATFDSLPPT
jgi:hypothetical protein